MTITDMFGETDVRPDEEQDTVPSSPDVTDPCKSCGRQIDTPYGGRGRRPTQCLECKAAKTPSKKRGPGSTGSAVTLAQQATEALWQINGIGAFLAMVAGYRMTASAIQERETVFREMAYNALLTDQNLCRYILKGGLSSSKVSLGVCYLMFGMGIVPTMMEERKLKRAQKEAEQDEYERTMNLGGM